MAIDNKYQDGKVYLIADVTYSKIYYGSTCESLSQRMARHRYSYERHLQGKYGKDKSLNCLMNLALRIVK